MKTFLFLLFNLSIIFTWAQDSSNQYFLKAYASVEHNRITFGTGENAIQLDTQNFRLARNTRVSITPAIRVLKPNAVFHEFQITYFSFNRNREVLKARQYPQTVIVEGALTNSWFAGIRYEIGKSYVLMDNEKRLTAEMGLATALLSSGFVSYPQVSTDFPTRQNRFSTLISFVPHLTYQPSKKVLLDLSVCLGLGEFEVERNTFEDPSLPATQQYTDHIDYTSFPRHHIARFGLSYRL
jgi:hypothetical protein